MTSRAARFHPMYYVHAFDNPSPQPRGVLHAQVQKLRATADDNTDGATLRSREETSRKLGHVRILTAEESVYVRSVISSIHPSLHPTLRFGGTVVATAGATA